MAAAEEQQNIANLGQYFTENKSLKDKVSEFVLNAPTVILEPSIGQGDLVDELTNKFAGLSIDMYEIDKSIKLLNGIDREKVIYGDFMDQKIDAKYMTIVGNPPYVKTRSSNLYIQFIEKCFGLLAPGGELIFIVPSDVFKVTNAHALMSKMFKDGCITHVYHPNDEKLFKNASIDVIVFRYCLDAGLPKTAMFNDKKMFVIDNNGMITFSEKQPGETIKVEDCFDVCVGIVCGCEAIYKSEELGNITVLTKLGTPNVMSKYILVSEMPSGNDAIDAHLLKNKDKLIGRRIRKFNENNWFEWGALRNVSKMGGGGDCIYVSTITRSAKVADVAPVGYFGGSLIMLKPKNNLEYTLESINGYLNSDDFKSNFMYSGRFKMTHRQISQTAIPVACLLPLA